MIFECTNGPQIDFPGILDLNESTSGTSLKIKNTPKNYEENSYTPLELLLINLNNNRTIKTLLDLIKELPEISHPSLLKKILSSESRVEQLRVPLSHF